MNYYEILYLSKNATQTEIKRSYKKLVKKYHPDLYSGDKTFAEQKIKQINEAYDILSNPKKKFAYDETFNQSFEPYTYPTNENSVYQSNVQKAESAFTNFMVDKLNHLTIKHQIQIFFFIFAITLTLFLINFFQVKYYLTSHSENNTINHSSVSNTTNSSFSNNSTENTMQNFDYDQSTFNILDDTFNDFWKSYFEEDYTNYEF